MKNPGYFHIYRYGVLMWPIGIISVRRVRGIGLGIWKHKDDRLCIGIGPILSFYHTGINWKVWHHVN